MTKIPHPDQLTEKHHQQQSTEQKRPSWNVQQNNIPSYCSSICVAIKYYVVAASNQSAKQVSSAKTLCTYTHFVSFMEEFLYMDFFLSPMNIHKHEMRMKICVHTLLVQTALRETLLLCHRRGTPLKPYVRPHLDLSDTNVGGTCISTEIVVTEQK